MKRYWYVLILVAGLQGSLYQASAQSVTGDIRGYFPQFVVGGGVESTIVVVNPSATDPVEGTIEFFDRLGNHMPLVVDQVAYGNGQVPFYLLPGGTRFFTADTADWPLETAWARIRAHSLVTSTILYSGSAGYAGFPGVDAALDYVIPVENRTGQARTALAVAHPGGGQSTVLRLKLVNLGGQVAPGGTGTVDLTTRGQMAAFVDELLPEAELSHFRGSLHVESDAGVALVALHSSPGKLSPLPVHSRDHTASYSFESNLQGWLPRAFDVDDGGAKAEWSIAQSTNRADDGGISLLFQLNNMTDAGKIWIQKPFLVEPNRKYKVKVSYSFATQDFGTQNLWRVIAGVRTRPPERVADLTFQSETSHGSPSDIGYIWLDKSYDFDVQSDADGLLYVFLGVWGTWETQRSYYIDRISVSIRE